MNRILSALLAFPLIGCVTGTDGKKQPHPILTVIAERGAEHGTRAHLRNHPEAAEKFRKATVAIAGKLSNTNRFTGDELGAILQTLPIDAFQGVEGALYVSDVAVIWDTIAQASTRIDGVATDIKPIAAAIARGMRRASQPPAPTPPPLPAASKYSQAEKDVMGTNYMFRKTAMARFAPAAVDGKIMRNPFMWEGVFRASAFQPSNTVLRVSRGGGFTFPGVAIEAACYFEDQSWVATMEGSLPMGWLIGEHEDCVYDPAPGLAQGFRVAGAPPWNGLLSLQHKSELKGAITNTAWFRSLP